MTSAPPEALAGSGTLDIVEYEPYIGPARVQSIRRAAAPLEGRSWTSINSTYSGGGVAEMLSSLVPLARGTGLDAEWLVIHGDDRFFQTTKKLHNLLQGVDQPINLDELNAYLDTIDDNMRARDVRSDLVVLHDSQPAAAIATGALFGNVVWRCHLDTSAPNKMVWRFLLPYINQCAGAIFTDPSFVGRGIQIPTYSAEPRRGRSAPLRIRVALSESRTDPQGRHRGAPVHIADVPSGAGTPQVPPLVFVEPAPEETGPSWLSFIGHETDSLWSVDLFRCESIVLRSYWVLVVMDQFTRRIVGLGVHCGAVDAPSLCRMFNAAIHGQGAPRHLSTDHDPLFEAHRWTAKGCQRRSEMVPGVRERLRSTTPP